MFDWIEITPESSHRIKRNQSYAIFNAFYKFVSRVCSTGLSFNKIQIVWQCNRILNKGKVTKEKVSRKNLVTFPPHKPQSPISNGASTNSSWHGVFEWFTLNLINVCCQASYENTTFQQLLSCLSVWTIDWTVFHWIYVRVRLLND